MGKIVSLEELLALRHQSTASGKSVVFTNGCFDILHLGHVRYLKQAKELGDVLVIGLNSDASTRKIKGSKRPLVPQDERAEILAALESVDYIVIFDEPTAEKLVATLKPQIYVKGGDYGQSGEDLPEADIVAGYGGRTVILPFVEGHSSTDMIRKVLEVYGTD